MRIPHNEKPYKSEKDFNGGVEQKKTHTEKRAKPIHPKPASNSESNRRSVSGFLSSIRKQINQRANTLEANSDKIKFLRRFIKRLVDWNIYQVRDRRIFKLGGRQ